MRMSRVLNSWLSKTSVIFLLSMKNEIQLISHLKIFFLFMMWINYSCNILRNASDMSSNSSVVTLFFFSHIMQIWLSRNVSTVSVNLFWHAFICYDESMSCFSIMLQSQVVIVTFIILSIIFSSAIDFQKLNS